MTGKQRYDNIRHLTGDELLRYHRHELLAGEEKLIAEHLKTCELCSDALNGVKEMHNALGMANIMYDLRRKMRFKFTPKKKILYRFELITILIAFFVIGVILFIGYYFLIFKK
jgi:hypothetical protein